MNFEVISNPSESFLKERDVYSWPVWTKNISEFPWTYNEQEQCYLLEGKVTVTPENGIPVTIEKGDFVIFPAGMNCTWNITVAIKKHYTFG